MRHTRVVPRPLLFAIVLAAGALLAWVAGDLRSSPGGARAAAAPAVTPSRAATPPPATAAGTLAEAPVREAGAPAPRRRSRALGRPSRGRLDNGVLLPAEGPDHIAYDAVLDRIPNREWRRWGTDVLIGTTLQVLAAHRAANPGAPKVLIGDLSRPRGGIFDQRYGGLGHASHQNGLDVDIYYPRRDRRLTAPERPSQVDRALAQDLVDRFVAVGAEFVFVGRRVGLRGPKPVVQRIPYHDDHLHVRIPNVTPRD